MPYINASRRIELTSNVYPETPGELNYCLTTLCTSYLSQGMSYKVLNEIIGALECCKQEFYSRVIVPYEEKKKEENGDVF